MESAVAENVREIRSRIEAAAARAGRDSSRVLLLAASKNRTPEEVRAAFAAGVEAAGENRVQELLAKAGELPETAEWHFIGHLQRNKVRQVVGLARLIHSVDSVRLAREIDRRAAEAGMEQRVLVQVNVAGEESKSGVPPGDALGFVEEIGRLGNVRVVGLSTIAPMAADPAGVRWVFRGLAELAGELAGAGAIDCEVLSMGMTGDFEVAVEEGSTCVRIGTGIFGARPQA